MSTMFMDNDKIHIFAKYFTEFKLIEIISKLNVHLIKPFVHLWYKFVHLNKSQIDNLILNLFQNNQNANLLFFKLLNSLIEFVNDENHLNYIMELYIQPFKFARNNSFNLFGLINTKNINQLLKNCLFNLSEMILKYEKLKNRAKIPIEDINAVLISSNPTIINNLHKFLAKYSTILNQNDSETLFNAIYDNIQRNFDENFKDTIFKILTNLKSSKKMNLIKEYLKKNMDNLTKIDVLVAYVIEIEDEKEILDLLECVNNTKLIDFLIQILKQNSNQFINDDLDFNSIVYLKINILRLFKKVLDVSLFKEYLITRLNIDCIFELIKIESEAMLRRELVLFLNELAEHLNDYELKYFEFYANLIKTDFDSDVQLNCLEFVKLFVAKNKTNELNLRMFKESRLFKIILELLNDNDIFDRLVKEEILIILNNFKMDLYLTEVFNLNEDFESKLSALKNSNDLYSKNSISILNDIISSYEFNLNDVKKISDCY
jgi:hypothetical protein